MTEVPEHLLRRSRERKAQASGATESDAPATESAATSSAVEPAAAAVPAPGGGGAPGKPAEPQYTGPPQPPKRNPRLPIWALPVVAALPFWAMLYAGAFGERSTGELTPVDRGAGVYSNCSTCHGAAGGGGVGPALDQVAKTFPAFADHVAWVTNGSAPVKGQTYGQGSRVATGGMPAFGDSLSPEDIVAVVCYERVHFGGEQVPPECEPGSSTATPTASEADNAEGTTENQDASGGDESGG